MKHLITSILLIFTLSTPAYCVSQRDIQMYSSLVDQWREQIVIAFNNAEKEVFPNTPVDPVEPIPDEDPAKCPCKGTGVIKHGDGHETECPFHSKQTSFIEDLPPLVKIKKSTCQCETKCECEVCECVKSDTELLLRKVEVR